MAKRRYQWSPESQMNRAPAPSPPRATRLRKIKRAGPDLPVPPHRTNDDDPMLFDGLFPPKGKRA